MLARAVLILAWGVGLASPFYAQQTSQAPVASKSNSTPSGKQSKATSNGAAGDPDPDIQCTGRDPDWTVEFAPGEARSIGITAPTRIWYGDWTVLTTEPGWSWKGHEVDTRADLEATVHPGHCKDPKTGQKLPYIGEIIFAHGGISQACCRKLRPGESAILALP